MSLGCLISDLYGNIGSLGGTLVSNAGNRISDIRSEQNLAAFYDASNSANLTLDGSNRVSQWNDTSPFASRHLTQVTVASQPIYTAASGGSPAYVLFDGVDDWLKTSPFTLNQPETVYLVASQVSWTLLDNLYDGNTDDSMGLVQYNTAAPQITMTAGTVLETTGPAVGALTVFGNVFNGASSGLSFNRSALVTGNAGAANAGGFTLGKQGTNVATRFGNIRVSAVAIFSVAHDARTRARVINYLVSRYNVPV